MKLEQYKLFLAAIDGLVIVDKEGTILMMEESLARSCWVAGEQMDACKVVGRHILEVIPTSNIMKSFEEKIPVVADYYFVEGRAIVSTRKLLYHEGEIIGALEYDLFGIEGEFLSEFLAKTKKISRETGFLKEDYPVQAKYTIHSIKGNSSSIQAVKDEIRVASKHNSTVLIEGETGSGKELIAHAIHALSDRQLAPFVRVNCAAIPETLLESELFGYEEGTFTGGKKGGKRGKIEVANGGTLFLDEINQMPLTAQPKLLRVLQEHEVTPVGSERTIPVDIRIIATSNQNLKKLVAEGKFREDLYYRLDVFQIKVPSLMQRTKDIPAIAETMIDKFNQQFDKEVLEISEEAMQLLKSYHWPGNIRQLSNVIERAMNHCEGPVLEAVHFKNLLSNLPETPMPSISLEQAKDHAERKAILHALKACNGNKVEAAKLLKISRSLIHKKIVKLEIKREEYM